MTNLNADDRSSNADSNAHWFHKQVFHCLITVLHNVTPVIS